MKRRTTFSLFCFLISVLWFPASGYAACTSPTGAASDVIYNADAHVPQYCNGVSWVVMAPTINLPVTNGLAGYWKLDDGSGTSAVDSSGNNNTGTLTGSPLPVWTTGGYYNGALTFNGTDYVSVPDAASLKPAAITVSAWINASSLTPGSQCGETNISYIVFKRNSRTGNFEGYDLSMRSDGSAGFDATDAGGNQGTANTASAVIVPGTWTHIVGTFSQPTLNFYVNGVLVASGTHNYPLDYGTLPVFIGRTGECGGIGHGAWDGYFNGTIDDVRIYNRALSAAEISTLYNYHISPPSSGLVGWWKLDESGGTTAADSSGNGNNSSVTGTTVVAGKINNARQFLATDQMSAPPSPSFDNLTQFTTAFWLKTSALNNIGQTPFTGNVNFNVSGFNFGDDGSSGPACSTDWAGGNTKLTISRTLVNDGVWHHLACTYDGTTARIYVDGVLQASQVQSYVPFDGNSMYTHPGWSSGAGTVIMDDVRLYNRALSADEIYGLYRTSSPVCSSPSGYEGDVMYNNGANHVLQFCDNASWRPLGPVPGAGGGGCSTPAHPEGDMIYSDSGVGSGVMQYCDGTNWIKLGGPNLPTNGLAGYWKFDETSGTSAADSSGNGNTGTLTGSPLPTWTTSGHDSGALTFNGTTNYVTVPYSSSLDFGIASFSVSLWMNASSLPSGQGALINKETGTESKGWQVRLESTGNVTLWVRADTTNFNQESTVALSTGQWYHLVFVIDRSSNTLREYVNGVEDTVHDGISIAGFGNFDADSTNAAYMGAERADSLNSYNGILDDVRIYNRALSAQEIWQLYNGT